MSSYTRTSYKSTSASLRYSSEGGDDYSSSRLSSSIRGGTGLSTRSALKDIDDTFSSTKRSSRLSDDDSFGLSTSRIGRRISKDNDDDLLSGSNRRSSRLSSRMSQDETESGYTSRRPLSKLSSDDDFGLTSTRRAMRGLEEDSSSYVRQSSLSSEATSARYAYKSSKLSSMEAEESYKSSSTGRTSKYALERDDSVKSYSATSKYLESSDSVSEKGSTYVAILDYKPPRSATDEIVLKEGQEVIVLSDDKPHKWKVQTKPHRENRIAEEGFVPSCYLEKKTSLTNPPLKDTKSDYSRSDSRTEYGRSDSRTDYGRSDSRTEYRRSESRGEYTRSDSRAESDVDDAKKKDAIKRRKVILKELIETEEDFNRDMQFIANTYLKHMDSNVVPKHLRDQKENLFGNFKEIADFHNNVLMKAIQYYSEEPSKLGNAFLRLERDFDKHVAYCRDLPKSQKLLEGGELMEYFNSYSDRIKDDKKLIDHLKLPVQRINDYQLLLKEMIKFTARLDEEVEDLQKAQELMQTIPQRANDLQYLNAIQGYKGNLHSAGRLLNQVLRAKDSFEVIDSEEVSNERFVFLFKNRLLITEEKTLSDAQKVYNLKQIIKISEADVSDVDDQTLLVQAKTGQISGLPLKMKAKTTEQKETWAKELRSCRQLTKEELAEEEIEIQLAVAEEIGAGDESAAKKPRKESIDSSVSKSISRQTTEDESRKDSKRRLSKQDSSEGKGRYSRQTTVESQSKDDKLSRQATLETTVQETSEMDSKKGSYSRQTTVESMDAASERRLSRQLTKDSQMEMLEEVASEGKQLSRQTTKDSQPEEVVSKFARQSTKESEKSYSRQVTREEEITDAKGKISRQTTKDSQMDTIETKPDTEEKPVFKEFLKTVSQIAGETAVFECEIDSKSPLTVHWLKDSQKVTESDKIRTETNGKKYRLIVHDADTEDVALYTIVAANQSGATSSSATLSVKSDPSKGDSRPTTPGGTLLPHPPVFKVKLKDTELLEGTTVRFELVVRGLPHPSVAFYKNGHDLEENERVTVLRHGKEALELVLKNVTQTDSGIYKCVAINREGEDETSGRITVLKDKVLFQGLTHELEAERASPRPRTPAFRWFKDGQEIDATERFLCQFDETEDTIAIVFQKVTPDDAGLYTCVASTSSGKMSCSAELTVQGEVHTLLKDPEAPSIKCPLSDVEVSEGASAVFEAKVTGYPKPRIVWCKDDEEIQSSERYKFLFEDEESYTLIVKKVTQKDVGAYKLKASNDLGEVETIGQLTVTCPPKFKKQLKDQAVNTDETLRLEVAVDAVPPPEVQWYKDGQPVHADDRVKLINEPEQVFALEIEKVKPEDAGNYSCVVNNPLGQQSGQARVNVNEPPSFVSGMKDVAATEGETVEFKVKVSGNPKPKVKFMKDNQTVVLDKKHAEVVDEENGSFTLILREVAQSDSGKYTCVATNEHGSQSSEGALKVKLTISSPSFKKGLSDISAQEDEILELSVQVNGEPQPEVKWIHDGKEIKPDERHEIVENTADGVYTLRINKVAAEDSGKYVVQAANSEGKSESSGKLTVASPPVFDQKLEDVSAKEGDEVKLKVKLRGNPKPKVQWSHEDSVIVPQEGHISTEEEDACYTLRIQDVQPGDKGVYSCVATNEYGEATTSGKVTVVGGRRKPQCKEGLKDVQVNEDEENLELTVQFEGEPAPVVQWIHNGKPVSEKDGYKIQENPETGKYSLVIPKVTKDTAGEYTAKAENSEGKAETTGKLTVSGAPKFDGELGNVTAAAGEDVGFKVKVDGEPKPKIKWTKDGSEIIPDGKHIIVKENENGEQELIIKNAGEGDAGNYGVIASNDFGSKSLDGTLEVKPSTGEPKSKPVFKKGLSNVEANEADANLEMKVVLEGSPAPKIEWFHNGNKIASGDDNLKIITSPDGTTSSLKIPDVDRSCAGEFTVAASNSEGTSKSDGNLKVYCAPRFEEQLKNISANEGDNIKLRVKVTGTPKPDIKFTKDGSIIVPDGKRIIAKEESGGYYELSINEVTCDDAGGYACAATNEFGVDISTGSVEVIGKGGDGTKPTFSRRLTDYEAKDGDEMLEMIVQVEGEPMPKVQWYRNGIAILSDDKYEIEERPNGTHVLRIRKVLSENSGKFSVTATNSQGRSECSGSLNVSSAPRFTQKLKNVSASPGDEVRLRVKVEGYPKPEIIWRHDGEVIVPDGKRIKAVEEESSGFSLIIDSANSNDSGLYQCEAKNFIGRAKSEGEVAVTGAPVFRRGLSDVEVDDGTENTVLMVIIEPQPTKPVIKWYIDDIQITELDERYTIIEDELNGIYKLVVKKASEGVVGTYKCTARNAYQESSTSGKFTIVKKPEFVEGLEDFEIVEGQSFSMTIVLLGSPTPNVKWYKDGMALTSSDGLNIIRESDQVYTLEFLNVTSEFHSGQYECKAQNSAGRASTSGKIDVLTIPRFVRNLEDNTAYVGESARLEVKVAGYPKPMVEWYKNGEKILTKIDAENNDNLYRLNFRNVKVEHDADYYCVAFNKVGEVQSKQGHLHVKEGGREGQPPRFIGGMQNHSAEAFDDVTFEVKVEGMPRPELHWYHNGSEIYDGDDYKMSQEPEKGLYSLRIPKVTPPLTGKYTAEAINSGGKVESSGSLDIASAPIITQRLGDIEASVGDEMVDLTIKVEGSPKPKVTWYHNGEPINCDDKDYEIIADKDHNTYTLRIPRVHADHGGRYSVKAENDEGKSESNGYMSINSEPTFIQKLKNVCVNPKEEARLEVRYRGYPQPNITWYKDGNEIIPDGRRYQVIEEEPYTSTLIIRSAENRDTGMYKCEAKNPSGRASTQAKLSVTAKPIIKREMTSNNLLDADREIKPRKPELEDYRNKMYREPFNFRSESKYQTGDDTYVLQYRDTDFPLRIREYLRVGCMRSPSLAHQLRQGHWGDANIGYGFSPQVSVRERRKFVDIMDEEIDDEKKGRDTRLTPMRLIREVGTPGYAYGQVHHLKQEAAAQLGKPPVKAEPPFFREKIKDVTTKEESEATFVAYAVGHPAPAYTWFRNDAILLESSRISIKTSSSGRCELKIKPIKAYDIGCYKCVARNDSGAVFCRARLKIGTAPGKPDPPVVKQSTDSQVYLCWSSPKYIGNSVILCYQLESKQSDATGWTQVADNIAHEFFVVHDLNAQTSYEFRVKAKNKFGWSEFSASSTATTTTSGDGGKISLPRAQLFRQKKTESGAQVQDDFTTEELDYQQETNPIPLNNNEHSELYNFVSEITRGRFSLIAKAFVKDLGTTLVCKATLTESENESGINNEYEILKSLCHERIVQLQAASRGVILSCLVLEKLSGIDVLTYLSLQQSYSEETVAKIILQVLNGLEYLHFRGICLLELQPDNVVMMNQRTPDIKLVDFANARRVPAAGCQVNIRGTTEYLAPEIIKKEDVSTATDVWCLGVLTYILLSGVSPFRGEEESETLENISFVRYHFDHLYKEVTQEAIRFLMLVFKRTPEKRPTLDECEDHKWLMPNEFMLKKREEARFSSEKVSEFADQFHKEKQASTPVKLFSVSGMTLTSE